MKTGKEIIKRMGLKDGDKLFDIKINLLISLIDEAIFEAENKGYNDGRGAASDSLARMKINAEIKQK